MTVFSRYIATLFCAVAFLGLGSINALAAEEIGAVKVVISYAYGTPPDDSKSALFKNNIIYLNETVETVTKGGLHITFDDGTDLRLGSKSSLVIDDFVYDPSNPNQAGVFTMTSGVFRFISGNMKKENYKILTPQAEIGIRGTDIMVTVGKQTTELAVFHGQATIKSRDKGGEPVTVNAGQKASTGGDKGTMLTGKAPANFTDKSLTDKAAQDKGRGSDGGDSSSSSSFSCFASGTEVFMADGTSKAIEAIRIGDRVLGQNGVINQVTGIETPELGDRWLYAINNGRPFVTAEHPFLTAQGWQAIDPQATNRENPAMSSLMTGSLDAGDQLVILKNPGGAIAPASLSTPKPDHMAIHTLTAIPERSKTTVYNLLLDGDHTYLVREGTGVSHWYRVHNKSAVGAGQF